VNEQVCEGGALDLGGGLLVILERALERGAPGDVLTVLSDEPSVEHDLPAWCRTSGHAYRGAVREGGRTRHRIERGSVERINARRRPDWGLRVPLRGGSELDLRDTRVGSGASVPERADPATGFSPRGAVVELGSPVFGFTLNERERVWADEAAELYEQGTAQQWDASRDIPWAQLRALPDPLEEAVCQLMTFLAENELSAMYVPARFLPRIHPHFIEVVLFLAQQQADEARHYEAFVKRALANGGGLRWSAASGQLSLKTLVEQEDFPAASFLLSVLGEGTFVDLLRFIEDHAPEGVTREIVRRARVDETRHVHFGVAHTRHFLAAARRNQDDLLDATRARAGALATVTSPSGPVLDALAILAAGSLAPPDVARGLLAARQLQTTMHENRVKRLVASGFSSELASELSRLHTHNFM
jgi:TusA-related sulfurtransferase